VLRDGRWIRRGDNGDADESGTYTVTGNRIQFDGPEWEASSP
jgi:hypothetical protein